MTFTGCDIISVARINQAIESNGVRFLEKTFAPAEIEYCSARMNPAMHYAGRFAAKEAVKKALLSSGMIEELPLSSIVITRTDGGAPQVELNMDIDGVTHVQVSISHTDELAIATAIVE